MKKIIILIIFSIFLFYCKNNNKKQENTILTNSNINFIKDSICSLQEDIDLIGNITSLNFLDSNHFIVTTGHPDPSLFIYNIAGKQENKIYRYGRGPYEYLEPSIVHVFNNKIYIWCSQQLKLIVLNQNGKPINEYTGFQKAIKDFAIWNNYICFYNTGGFKEGLIEIYDMKQNKYISDIGNVTNEHSVLSLTERSGGMILLNNNLYFISSDILMLYKLNLTNMKLETSSKFKDSEFQIAPIGINSNDFINNERNKIIPYLFNNSIITNLFYSQNHIIIQSEVGKYSPNKKVIDYSKRYLKYYFSTKDMNIQNSIKINYDINNNILRYSCFNNKLYTLSTYIKNENLIHILYEISFNNIQ